MNKAHNLSIDELIQVLQTYKINGARYVDVTIHSPFDIGIKESVYEEEPPQFSLKDINLLDLT